MRSVARDRWRWRRASVRVDGARTARQILVPLRRVATGQLAECGDVLDEAFVVGIRDGVGSEGRDHPAGETVVAQAPMMAQAAEWRVGRGDDVDAEPVEQGTRPELVAARQSSMRSKMSSAVCSVRRTVDAEDLVQDVVHPQPRRRATEQVVVRRRNRPPRDAAGRPVLHRRAGSPRATRAAPPGCTASCVR